MSAQQDSVPARRRLLIMGPPGAGKGTQAVGIAARLQVPAISTGDMFRALQQASTPLATKVRAIMAAGGYVDDATTNAIVDDRLEAADCADGFLLDGYPRTLTQVHHLDELLWQQRARLDAVVCLDVDEDEVLRRLLARGRDQSREDDQADTIRNRLAVYREQTAPLIEQYRHRGLLSLDPPTGIRGLFRLIDEGAGRVRAWWVAGLSGSSTGVLRLGPVSGWVIRSLRLVVRGLR